MSESNPHPGEDPYPSGRPVALLPLALISLATLALEVHLTRVLSYAVSTSLLYVILGIALLGFGAAGSLVTLVPRWLDPDRVERMLVWAALAAVAVFIISPAAFLRLTPWLRAESLFSLLAAPVLTLPFLAAAVVVTLALSSTGGAPGRAYAANLIGSGLGCFVPLWLLGPLDGQLLLALLAGLVWLAALLYLRRLDPTARKRPRTVALVALPLLVLTVLYSHRVFLVHPEPSPSGQVALIREFSHKIGARMKRVYDRWNATGRIEVFAFSDVPDAQDPYPYMFYAQDSTAGSMLVRWDGRDSRQVQPSAAGAGSNLSRLCSETVYAHGYFRKRPRVLVIGLGGGPDLQCALYHGARSVDVVEINPDSIRLVRGKFNDWLGGVGRDARVRFYNRDGRSFVHGAKKGRYDLIQLSGVDTKQVLASGSLALNENNLYTREAFLDYLKSLNPGGVLSIIRFGEPETLRLANTAVWALRRLGERHPERNVTIVSNQIVYAVLVRRTAFPEGELSALVRTMAPPHFRGVNPFFYSIYFAIDKPVLFQYLPGSPIYNHFFHFFAQVAGGDTSGFINAHPRNIQPATDDRPFFFDVHRYDRSDTWRNSSHIIMLRNLLFAMLSLSLLLILLPVVRTHRQLSGIAARFLVPLFFACVGLAYLLVEVWMLNRFGMYLGHQTRALAVVLCTLLVSSGLGAWGSERVLAGSRQRAWLGTGAIVLMLVAASQALPWLIEATWHLGDLARSLLTMALVAPAGIAMGLPFVAGLSWIHARYPAAVPWCIGINGFCSVLATVLVIPLSVTLGYSAVLATGVGLYALAFLLASSMSERLSSPQKG